MRDGIGTLLRFNAVGCQGFPGPLPSAFLDKKCLKNCRKDKAEIESAKYGNLFLLNIEY
jgi:hypothetical protein